MADPGKTASETPDEADREQGIPVIPGFTELTQIGRGGFSVVYSAREEGLHRRVAIKVISSDEEAGGRLEREVRALGMLDDVPNIVSAHSVVRTAGGQPALIMALFRRSLGQCIKAEGGQPVDIVCEWAKQLARCLDQAHVRGIVHRDVKPENVLLDDSNSAHLADFGIAAMESLVSRTATVMSISPPHAPPERLNGVESGGTRGDVYSLASTMYYALAGRPPFGTTASGGAAGLIMRIVNDPLPSDVNISDAMLEVFSRGMSKDPAERFPTATSFATALAAAAAVPDDVESTRARKTSNEKTEMAAFDQPADHTRVGRTSLGDNADVASVPELLTPPVITDSPLGGVPQGQGPAHFDDSSLDEPEPGSVDGDHRGKDREKVGSGRGRFVAGGILLMILLLAFVGRTAFLSEPDRPLGLGMRVLNSTADLPLPDDFVVNANGKDYPVKFDGKWAHVVVPDAFKSGDRAKIKVQLPDGTFDFTASAGGKIRDGNRVGELAITDDWIRWEEDKKSRDRTPQPDPTTSTETVKPRDDSDLIEVAKVVGDVIASTKEIDKQFDALFASQKGVPYAEIKGLVDTTITPGYEALIDTLKSTGSNDPKGRAALDATELCLTKKLTAFERQASFDSSKSEKANADEQKAVWSDATPACDAANAKIEELGVA